MNLLEIACWICLAVVVYPYVIYPVILAILARLGRRRVATGAVPDASVSVVLAVFNEAEIIERRIEELIELLVLSRVRGEIIVVSDGSTDATAELIRSLERDAVEVIELPRNVGKAAAVTQGCAAARHDIIVFADARQSWSPESLRLLMRNFADPSVGAVGGNLMLDRPAGVMAGVSLYWRHEKWLRRQESRLHSTVGVSGAIAAVRRELFQPIPAGTLLDDVYWPVQVALAGYRVVHEDRAEAYDRLPARASDEFRRKVRTLSGNFQLCSLLPRVLLPWRNPIWFQFVSHKLMRLAVPWALLALLPIAAALPGSGYRCLFGAQVFCYLLAIAGIVSRSAGRSRLASTAASFLVLNSAAFLAFWIWISGRATRSWCKVPYEMAPRIRPRPMLDLTADVSPISDLEMTPMPLLRRRATTPWGLSRARD